MSQAYQILLFSLYTSCWEKAPEATTTDQVCHLKKHPLYFQSYNNTKVIQVQLSRTSLLSSITQKIANIEGNQCMKTSKREQVLNVEQGMNILGGASS